MAKVAQSALDSVKELYERRDARARELAGQGKTVIGYFCCYTPVEIFTALDVVPYRIQGAVGRPLEQVNQHFETIACPYVRSCFDLALTGKYDFLSGIVIPHTCDATHRLYDIWKYHMKPRYGHVLTVPHMTHWASFEFFEKELQLLQRSLERFTGRSATEDDLVKAVRLHNRSRALRRKLYELRKPDPPLVTGTEVIQLLVADMTLPVEEFNGLLEGVIQQVSERPRARAKVPRLLLVGSEMDDVSLVRLTEECGAAVVMDDLCTGSRSFWKDVETSRGVLAGLAERYLGGISCPCTYREGKAAQRFAYLQDYARDWNVQGALLYAIRFCDTYQLDAPEIQNYLMGLGLPVLHIEHDYVTAPIAQWKTRVEAFLETIEARKKE